MVQVQTEFSFLNQVQKGLVLPKLFGSAMIILDLIFSILSAHCKSVVDQKRSLLGSISCHVSGKSLLSGLFSLDCSTCFLLTNVLCSWFTCSLYGFSKQILNKSSGPHYETESFMWTFKGGLIRCGTVYGAALLLTFDNHLLESWKINQLLT